MKTHTSHILLNHLRVSCRHLDTLTPKGTPMCVSYEQVVSCPTTAITLRKPNKNSTLLISRPHGNSPYSQNHLVVFSFFTAP